MTFKESAYYLLYILCFSEIFSFFTWSLNSKLVVADSSLVIFIRVVIFIYCLCQFTISRYITYVLAICVVISKRSSPTDATSSGYHTSEDGLSITVKKVIKLVLLTTIQDLVMSHYFAVSSTSFSFILHEDQKTPLYQ